MDSTKKVTKKLAGEASKTAAWCTNVSNEHGQVLMSVMTAAECRGLDAMVHGIVRRYKDANMAEPLILYVDGHCCGSNGLIDIFHAAFPKMHVRLDVWHFMKRLSVGVSTDTHRLYSVFMGQISHAIFELDATDMALLKHAKRHEMVTGLVPDPSDDVINNIARKELSLHCRRTTRNPVTIITMIQQVIEMFDGEEGRDTMGVPLFHHKRIWTTWEQQKKHVSCLVDPKGVQMYTKTGTLKKGEVILPKFRCARGSTSLESFHLHLDRFIPGTSANANNFQAYLLEGLARWNEDRARAAVEAEPEPLCYDMHLKEAVNRLGQEMLGCSTFPNFKAPLEYTGELIGIEYLNNQTGIPIESSEEKATGEEGDDVLHEADEGFEEEKVEDLTTSYVETFLPSKARQEALAVMQSNRPSRLLKYILAQTYGYATF